MRTDRFQPQGPVRDPAPRDWWRVAREVIPMLGFAGGVLAYATGYITTNATDAVEGRYAAKHQKEFEASADARLKEAWARMDQIDRDRESRTVISNKLTSDLGDALRAQIDAVNHKLDQRSEARGNQVNDLAQRLSNLELRVCVLSGNKVAQCK